MNTKIRGTFRAIHFGALSFILATGLGGCGAKLSSLTASGGSDGGITTTNSFGGTISAGPVSGATVTAYALNASGTQGTQLATATSDANGKYSLKLSPQSGPVVIIASGGSYKEEASGATVNMGSAQIRTLLPSVSANQQVAVTPVTEIAAQNAIAAISSNASVSLASLITSSNSSVASAMGLTDITVPPANPTQSVTAAANPQAAQYAMVLASISQMATIATSSSGASVNSLDMMQALATSFTYNGGFGSTVGATAVPVPNASNTTLSLASVLTAVGGSTSFSTAMTSATNTYAASPAATSVGYNVVTTPTYVTAPPVTSGTVAIAPPPPPTSLPYLPPAVSGLPPLPGQTGSAAPTLSYSGSSGYQGTVGYPLTMSPSILMTNGAQITGCAIKTGTTALPTTLTVNASTCVISGTPTAILASTTYTVVATNSVGTSSDATITLNVTPVTPHIYIADNTSGELVCTVSSTTGAIGTCAGHQSGPILGKGTTAVVSGANASIYLAEGSIGDCAVTVATGAMNCTNGGTVSLSNPSWISMHSSGGNLFAYTIDNNGVNFCQTSASTGQLTSCVPQNAGLTTPVAGQSTLAANWQPVAVDFFTALGGATYAYVTETHSFGSVFICSVDNTLGTLSSCAASSGNGLPTATDWGPSQISIRTVGSNTYAYIAGGIGNIYKCTVNPSSGGLSGCVVSNGGVTVYPPPSSPYVPAWQPTGIYLTNLGGAVTYAYISDQLNSQMWVCTVNTSDGTLAGCTVNPVTGLSQPYTAVVF